MSRKLSRLDSSFSAPLYLQDGSKWEKYNGVFMFDDNRLKLFASGRTKPAREIIVTDDSDAVKDSSDDWAFKIITPGERTFVFKCDSRAERDEWMSVFGTEDENACDEIDFDAGADAIRLTRQTSFKQVIRSPTSQANNSRDDSDDDDDDFQSMQMNDGVVVAYQGYISKRGERNRAFKRRWFVLDGKGILSYYDSQKAYEKNPTRPNGCIRLQDRFLMIDSSSTAFSIEHPKDRVFALKAEKYSDRDRWVEALSRFNVHAKETTTSYPASRRDSTAPPPLTAAQQVKKQAAAADPAAMLLATALNDLEALFMDEYKEMVLNVSRETPTQPCAEDLRERVTDAIVLARGVREALVDRAADMEQTLNDLKDTLATRQKILDEHPPGWVDHDEVDFCSICESLFSFFKRKHHCRKCGDVVCAACSPGKSPIPEFGNTKDGTGRKHTAPVRICVNCLDGNGRSFSVA